ncbi:DUF1772 domain-containing protein [Hymenobacter bucti]|uniref:DUF1772 domain-containing protein n=1 Tax=Hymenobacter bucti TaxID=1844114 RepID=A0ABW4QZN9_9BACT
MPNKSWVLLLAMLPTGLITGVFYGFSVAINPALARLPDAVYLETMQAINEVIQNPLFGLPFFGAPLLLLWATWLHRRAARSVAQPLRLAALLYLVGNLGVTLGANVPLNEELAAFPIAHAQASQVATLRTHFARTWTGWHTVRTVASVGAWGLLLAACLADATPRAQKKA